MLSSLSCNVCICLGNLQGPTHAHATAATGEQGSQAAQLWLVDASVPCIARLCTMHPKSTTPVQTFSMQLHCIESCVRHACNTAKTAVLGESSSASAAAYSCCGCCWLCRVMPYRLAFTGVVSTTGEISSCQHSIMVTVPDICSPLMLSQSLCVSGLGPVHRRCCRALHVLHRAAPTPCSTHGMPAAETGPYACAHCAVARSWVYSWSGFLPAGIAATTAVHWLEPAQVRTQQRCTLQADIPMGLVEQAILGTCHSRCTTSAASAHVVTMQALLQVATSSSKALCPAAKASAHAAGTTGIQVGHSNSTVI